LNSPADFARLSLKLSLSRRRDAWQPRGDRKHSRYRIARTRFDLLFCHLHRDALVDSRADEVADSGPAKIVQNSTRASRVLTGRPKSNPEALDRLPRPMEDPRTNDLAPSLQILGDPPARDRSHRLWQSLRHCQKLLALEEPDSDVVLLEVLLGSPLDIIERTLSFRQPPRAPVSCGSPSALRTV